jgi:hypothetical protein
MQELTKAHDEVLARAAAWIKGRRKKYCPITAISDVGHWRKLAKELESTGLIYWYKAGETIGLTGDGWRVIADKHPEIAGRHRGPIKL